MFSENPNGERRFYEFAQKKLAAAAARSGSLVERAETNTTRMLQGLLAKLGYTNVQVDFRAR